MAPAGEPREHLRLLRASGVTIGQAPGHPRPRALHPARHREGEARASAAAHGRGDRGGAARDHGGSHARLRQEARRLLETMAAAGVGTDEVAAALRCEHSRALDLTGRTYVTRRSWDRLVTLYRYLARQGLVAADLLEEVGS